MANFSVLPPEINSALIYTGAGAAPLLRAATAWNGLASELGAAATSFSAVTSGLAGQAWQGAASAAMAANTGPDISGFGNSASGGDLLTGELSGFGNTAADARDVNGFGSGFFNTGVAGPVPGSPLIVSGFDSGLLHIGSEVSGFILNISQALP
jgi:hypothetical protein